MHAHHLKHTIGTGHSMFAAYSSVMLVAGGSGISHTLGIAHDLLSKAASQGSIRATHLDIVWCVKSQEIARPLIATFKSLIEDIKRAPLAVRVQIFITRPEGDLSLLSPSTQEKMNAPFAMPGTMTGGVVVEPTTAWSCGAKSRITIVTARPSMRHLLESLIDSTLSIDAKSQGCGIAVCGPPSLVESTSKAVLDMDDLRRLAVGGIELLQVSYGPRWKHKTGH